MRQLAVAEYVTDIKPVFRDMHEHRRPGFQVSPDVPIDACLAALEGYMQEELGQTDFKFDTAFGNERPTYDVDFNLVREQTGGHDAGGRHIDEYESKHHAGIAVHNNVQGSGHVILQLAKLGVTEIEPSNNSVLSNLKIIAGRRYVGELVPGIKTVFSEGLIAVGGLHQVSMGAAIHEFTSVEGFHRQWTRYTCSPQIEE